MKLVPPVATGFRRAVADEALDEEGALVYVVRLYRPDGSVARTHRHATYAEAAQEISDWFDWSERLPPRFP